MSIRRMLSEISTTGIVAILLCAAPGHSSEAKTLPGSGITVKPCYDQLTEAVFQTDVVIIGLEKLGYQVADLANVTIPLMYVSTAQGDVDFCADAYDPLQDHYFEKAGGDAKLTRVGVLIKGATQGYLIDKRTADKYGIHNVAQFKDPKIAALFDNDGDGKADLAGCPPGWGCELAIEHQLDAYGLRGTVKHHQGEFLIMAADTISRFKAGQSVFYYTYNPLWVSQILVPGKDVEFLEVPFTALPDKSNGEGTDLTIVDGKNLGFTINKIRVIANNDFLAKNPAAKKWFELVTIPIEDVNAENLQIHNGESSLADVRRHAETWVKAHQTQVEAWVQEAQNATP
jgi:glycine betaine/proline transport system substrate-binding protein